MQSLIYLFFPVTVVTLSITAKERTMATDKLNFTYSCFFFLSIMFPKTGI